MVKKTEKNKEETRGRKKRDTVYCPATMPRDMHTLVRGVGLNSPSHGFKILWNEIKDTKEVKDLLKRFKVEL